MKSLANLALMVSTACLFRVTAEAQNPTQVTYNCAPVSGASQEIQAGVSVLKKIRKVEIQMIANDPVVLIESEVLLAEQMMNGGSSNSATTALVELFRVAPPSGPGNFLTLVRMHQNSIFRPEFIGLHLTEIDVATIGPTPPGQHKGYGELVLVTTYPGKDFKLSTGTLVISLECLILVAY